MFVFFTIQRNTLSYSAVWCYLKDIEKNAAKLAVLPEYEAFRWILKEFWVHYSATFENRLSHLGKSLG
jgi:hypothetical protein